ncbi:MAG: sigma-70 family RNA polymerase sigma factor [Planctomycetota bacterium]|nr:sigma-70 family RNA polymerase sigma factor [Planctomycetota bacterium]
MTDMETTLRKQANEPRIEEYRLAASAIEGDRDAIDALWTMHRRWVAAVILTHKSRDEDLEDLLQEVAMTLVGKISTVRDPRHVRAWLRTVAINASRAAARSSQARPRLRLVGTEPEASGAPSIDVTAAKDEETRRLLGLVAKLPEAYREPLMLRALHGMRSRQIAEILDLPEATIDTRISRARKMLRDLARGDEVSPDRKIDVDRVD